MADSSFTYEQAQEAADFIKDATKTTAKVAVITGSALGVLPKCCAQGGKVTCSEIPHVGECADDNCSECPNILYTGQVGDACVIAMIGRPSVLPDSALYKTSTLIKTLKLMGVETVILIGPAGALNPDYKVGDVMIVKDHVNFMGLAGYNPLLGKNDERFGPRYVGANKAYSEELRTILNTALTEAGYSGTVYEGIYLAITGPAFPTAAEIEFLRTTRADAVGMYITPEALSARQCGMDVIAMCIITEECAAEQSPDAPESNYENIAGVGDEKLDALNSCIEKVVTQLDERSPSEPPAEPPPEEPAAEEAPPEEPPAEEAPAEEAPAEEAPAEEAPAEEAPAEEAPPEEAPPEEAPPEEAPPEEAPPEEAPPEEAPPEEAPPEEKPPEEEAPEAPQKDMEVDVQSTLTAGACCRCALGSNLTDATSLPYDSIPNFPPSNTPVGKVTAGNIGDTPIILMQGRYHCYDGYTMQQCTMYVRVLKLIGIETVIIINVSGGINEEYKLGDVMLIKDHVNLLGFSGQNPLVGPNDDRFGPRFFSLNKAYHKELLENAKTVFTDINFEGGVHEGVYAAVSGPAYETVTENVFLKTCGIDAVGMTIVPEVMVAKHSNMLVMAFTIITDEAVLDESQDKEISHEEMVDACNKTTEKLNEFLEKFVPIAITFHPPGAEDEAPPEAPPEAGDDAAADAGADAEGAADEVAGAVVDAVPAPDAGAEEPPAEDTTNAATFTSTCCNCALGSNVTDEVTVPYETIPNFPPSKDPVGKVIAGTIGGAPVIIMQGRYHHYDGYTAIQSTMFIRVLKLLGIEDVIITNASGAINPDYKLGDVVLIKDHVNMMGFSGQNPLVGPNDERFGPRFLPLNKAYDKELITKAKDALQEMNFEGGVYEGVYAVVCGPAYETIAENIFLKECEIDVVGMSIVPEVIVARHCGMDVLAFSIITDESVLDMDSDQETNEEEMLEMCNKRTEQLNEFLEKFLANYQPSEEEAPPAEDAEPPPDAEPQPDAEPEAEAPADAAPADAAPADSVSSAAANLASTCCKCTEQK